MNVPFPAPCRVSAARVGKLSVWGLRIITELTTTLPFFFDTVNHKKVAKQGPRVERIAHEDGSVLILCNTYSAWDSRRESNPDFFVGIEASLCVRPREH